MSGRGHRRKRARIEREIVNGIARCASMAQVVERVRQWNRSRKELIVAGPAIALVSVMEFHRQCVRLAH